MAVLALFEVAVVDSRIAVLLPCHNEAVTIAKVVADFRRVLPDAGIFVYDNNSTDGTAAAAASAGAVVRYETIQGKGNVVRRMFADVQADIYVLVDGDDTYQASAAPEMIRLLVDNQLDMVNAVRVTEVEAAYRPGHRFGNVVLTAIVRWIFGDRIRDMLSGYRVFSRRFVKSFPALASGFETETEFTVHALELNMPVGQVIAAYKDRPAGSASKLRTYSDGLRILRAIVMLVKERQPLPFFASIALALLVVGVGVSVPVIRDYLRTGLVPRLPTAVLSAAIVELSVLSLVCGLILDSVARGRKEATRLAYLSIPPVEASTAAAATRTGYGNDSFAAD
jgi:glycosyltransferase involved in cell wall biosynthesis